MSDTPETDAEAWIETDRANAVVFAKFARKLERERDEARESLKHITEYGTEEINAAVELRQKLATALVERDEALKNLEEEMKFHHRTHSELVKANCKILDLQMLLDHLTPQTQTKKNQ